MRDIQLTTYTVGDFVSWARSGLLELNPRFQRRPVWKKGAKSYLIDTILRGLPIPIIFLRDRHADTKTYQAIREVVDGQQRIRTILSFIDPKLVKEYKAERDSFTIDEEHNEALAGSSFKDLDPPIKQTILDYKFSVQVFPAETGDREILQIFARMNSTGLKVNYQELRNAEFFGKFKTLAYQLATEQLERWREWRIFTDDQIARMNEVELTSEFMLLAMDGVLEKKQSTIDEYYNRYNKTFPDGKEVSRRFQTTMDTLQERFFSGDGGKLLRSRTVFYALFAAVHGIQFGLRDPSVDHVKMTSAKAKPVSGAVVEHVKRAAAKLKEGNSLPRDVASAAKGATAHAGQRSIIIGYLAGPENNPCRPRR